MPRAVSPLAIRLAARLSLPQVKQWANSAQAAACPAGRSSSAESFSPRALGNSKRSDGMSVLRCRVMLAQIADDRTDHVGIVVGPDALARVRLDRRPVLVCEQAAETLLLRG